VTANRLAERPADVSADGSPARLIIDRLSTPIGVALLAFDPAGRLRAFYWDDKEAELLRMLRRQYGKRVSPESGQGPPNAIQALEAYFAGELAALNGIECRTVGTSFQQAVWAALRTIPPGQTLSYGALANRIGAPKAVRAVGLANGSNPIAVVVPCHRVIGANRTLTGYGGGIERKRWLLTHEGASFAG
jgi:methylated-DNA-[protein]-cysteine S-methyltransferase